MLTRAVFNNFTTTPNDEWRFSPNLNIIIGENGLGKTHVLKALYALLKTQSNKNGALNKSSLEKAYAEKLMAVFRPESLGRLVKRKQGRGRSEISIELTNMAHSCSIAFATQAKSQVEVLRLPTEPIPLSPVFLPTRELVTLCPWFAPLYDNYHLEFEETWRDTVSLLGAPAVKGPREKRVQHLVSPLEDCIGGKVTVDPKTGRFYLSIAGEGTMEMPLVAEGWRKLAMLTRLISTGVLLEQGYLFWDEPETNLNPKLLRILAQSIVHLAAQGIQVFIATHSLFLLREFEILLAAPSAQNLSAAYFGLHATEEGVYLEQATTLTGINHIAALDASLEQSDRYLDLL